MNLRIMNILPKKTKKFHQNRNLFHKQYGRFREKLDFKSSWGLNGTMMVILNISPAKMSFVSRSGTAEKKMQYACLGFLCIVNI